MVPLLMEAQPIHPGVLTHFGMSVPQAGHRYPMLDEGRFTFEEYCRRYLCFEWNEALHQGIALARTDPEAAIPKLQEGLQRSPDSRAGKRALKLATEALAPSTALVPVASGETAPEPEPPEEPFTLAHVKSPAAAPQTGRGLTMFAPPGRPASELAVVPQRVPVDADAADAKPADQGVSAHAMREEAPPAGYVELPPAGEEPPAPKLPPPTAAPNRYTPLAPSLDLIEVLPRLLHGDGRMTTPEREFASMPETMPPPPSRPMLPPELQAEPVRQGLLARLSRFFKG